MRREHSGLKQFFVAFSIGIMVLSIPFSYAIFRFAGSKILASSQPENYYPQSSDAITLTVALRETGKDKPHSILLCKVDPLETAVKIAVIPPETMVEDAGRFDSVANVWRREGAKRAADALENALEVSSDRWLDLSSDSISKLGDVVGAIDFTLDQSLQLESGLSALPQGRQLIDGRRATILMNYTGYPGGEASRLKTIEDLTEQMLIQRLPLMTDSLLLKAFETAVNTGYSDLTVGDFESRRRALAHMLSRSLKVEVVAVQGEYNAGKNTFLPSAQTLSALSDAFNTQKRSSNSRIAFSSTMALPVKE